MALARLRYGSSKTYTHAQGLSCCFRQWGAKSHCRFFHGYALQVEVEFEARYLDDNNWVQDFGGLKWLKQFLEESFDHKMLVARNDPQLALISQLAAAGAADVVVVDAIGTEAFAEYIFRAVEDRLYRDWQDRLADSEAAPGEMSSPRVRVQRVTVREHAGNAAFVTAAD